VVVAFSDQTGLWWLRILKPGFRHCFAYISTAEGWIALDPLSHQLHLAHHAYPPGADLAATLRQAGWPALTVALRPAPLQPLPPAFFSCVEVVKRVIGINSPLICTPWQLFCVLRKITLDGGFVSFYSYCHIEQNKIIKGLKQVMSLIRTSAAGLVGRKPDGCRGEGPWVDS